MAPRVLTALGLALWLAEIVSASLNTGFLESFHDNAVLASVLLPAFVVAAKNRPLWLGAGILFPLVWVVPTFRLAPPGSMWARGVYDEGLRERAADRFGDRPSRDWSRALTTVVLALVLVFIVGRGLLLPVFRAA